MSTNQEVNMRDALVNTENGRELTAYASRADCHANHIMVAIPAVNVRLSKRHAGKGEVNQRVQA